MRGFGYDAARECGGAGGEEIDRENERDSSSLQDRKKEKTHQTHALLSKQSEHLPCNVRTNMLAKDTLITASALSLVRRLANWRAYEQEPKLL